jgi:short-subunit dehydrogenase
VFMSSLAGFKPNPRQTVYSITKSGVHATADALRTEFAPQGFQVMCVALPSVGTMHRHESGQVPVAVLAQRLERAIGERRDELWLSSLSKYLMRAYRAWPALAKRTRA